jgi:hypothetical protein
MIGIISSLSEKEILKAPKSKVPVVFLGGKCKNNDWREEIKKEFGEDLNILDPFDKNYDQKEDTYKELAGMVNSEYVIFYNGGEQSEREKKFLDLIDRRDNLIKDFDDLNSLKKFLKRLKGVTLESIGSRVRKCAKMLSKCALPHFDLSRQHRGVDLHFEKMDSDSIYKVVQDFFAGKTIKVPRVIGPDGSVEYSTLNINDFEKSEFDDIQFFNFMSKLRDKSTVERIFGHTRQDSNIFSYNDKTHEYEEIGHLEPAGHLRCAKEGVTYDYSCTKACLPEDLSESVMKWGRDNIKDEDLYVEDDSSKGREDDIHITVLYGIVDNKPKKTAVVIGKAKPFEVRLGLINAFKDNDKYDVLKIEVESGDIEKLHYAIAKSIKNENTFPTYHPHVTILYAKKGEVDKYIGDEYFKGKTFMVDKIVFDNTHGDSFEIALES